jgi:hypothetical protein
MSRTWPLKIDVSTPAPGFVVFEEYPSGVDVEIEYPGTCTTSLGLTEDTARDLYEWLGWYLGESDEPQELRSS